MPVLALVLRVIPQLVMQKKAQWSRENIYAISLLLSDRMLVLISTVSSDGAE